MYRFETKSQKNRFHTGVFKTRDVSQSVANITIAASMPNFINHLQCAFNQNYNSLGFQVLGIKCFIMTQAQGQRSVGD